MRSTSPAYIIIYAGEVERNKFINKIKYKYININSSLIINPAVRGSNRGSRLLFLFYFLIFIKLSLGENGARWRTGQDDELLCQAKLFNKKKCKFVAMNLFI